MDLSASASVTVNGSSKPFTGDDLESAMMSGVNVAKATFVTGTPPAVAVANDEKSASSPAEPNAGFTGEVQTDSTTTEKGEVKTIPTEAAQLTAVHFRVINTLTTNYGLISAVQKVCENPLRMSPHVAKASRVLLEDGFIHMDTGVITPPSAETMQDNKTIPLFMLAFPSLMQGTATGTTQFKMCIEAWRKAKKAANSLTDDDYQLTCELLTGALGLFQKDTDKFYRMVLVTNRSPGMSKSSREKIRSWVNSLEVCVDNYWVEYRAKLLNKLLIDEIEEMAEVSVSRKSIKVAAVETADD